MNVDFLNQELGTTAYTNVVSSDGFDVTNLLLKPVKGHTSFPKLEITYLGSRKDAANSCDNGFMADYFVKPPVDIVVQFPCLLDITKIIVNRRSGGKRVAEFIIFSANAKPQFHDVPEKPRIHAQELPKAREQTALLENTTGSFLQDIPCKYDPDFTLAEIRRQNKSALHTIGRFSSQTTDADIVIFKNPRGRYNDDHNRYDNQSTHAMPLFSTQHLYGVSHLILRILRTEESTVAAIKRLEAWGRPSKQNKDILNAKIHSLIRQYQDRCIQKKDIGELRQNVNIQIDSQKEKKPEDYATHLYDKNQNAGDSGPSIPEDFLDPITCEIMMLPVLLPSGLTIDSETLEKCKKEDERNGRMPLDPFTGIPLGGESKPVPNTALKLRIDNFLLQNKFHINRQFTLTSGVSSLDTGVIERVVKNKRKRKIEFAGERNSGRTKISNLLSNISSVSGNNILVNNFEQAKMSRNPQWRESMRFEKHKRTERDKLSLGEQIHISNENMRDFENNTGESHEATLQNSLEAALKQVAGSVLKSKKEKSDPLPEFTCSSCKRHGKDINLFQLPCHHLSCRKCIQEASKTKKCTICCTRFSNSDVTRVHFSEYFNS